MKNLIYDKLFHICGRIVADVFMEGVYDIIKPYGKKVSIDKVDKTFPLCGGKFRFSVDNEKHEIWIKGNKWHCS